MNAQNLKVIDNICDYVERNKIKAIFEEYLKR